MPCWLVRVPTAQYMAPELFRSEPFSAKTDVYAFGLMWYEILSGEGTPRPPSPTRHRSGGPCEDPSRRKPWLGVAGCASDGAV